jgi:hypothetical protein
VAEGVEGHWDGQLIATVDIPRLCLIVPTKTVKLSFVMPGLVPGIHVFLAWRS